MSAATATIEALREALGDRAAALDIECVAETGSTNADLLAALRGGDAAPRTRLLVAERQNAGRGRQGRAWHAAPAASLTFSLAFMPARSSLAGLSLAVGVAVADAIEPRAATRRRIGLKWPNDLWLVGEGETGRKLGGILVETAPVPGGRAVVIGIGLNVFAQHVAEAASGVAWLREIDAGATPHSALLRIAPALLEALESFEHVGFAAFAARFAARDLLRGRAVRVAAGAGLDGLADGVTAEGELLVRTLRGIERVSSGEVTVRLADPGAPATQAARSPC